jgi:endonuclease G, mitochondrial
MNIRTIFFQIFLFFIPFVIVAQQTDLLLPSTRDREQIIHHKGYTLSYNSSYLLPSWVSYRVTKSQVNDEVAIKGKYIPDPQVNTKSADKKDYKEGGYLMAQFVNYLDIMQIPDGVDETFYMTNITPMKLAFDNHIWCKAERLIRMWTAENDGFYVVCGPILADSPFTPIGDNHVSVPKRYYKAIYDPVGRKAIGFIFKNGMSSGTLKSFAVSIDEIEQETGIDLFTTLDDELEKQIEMKVNFEDWNFDIIEK